MLVAFAGPAAGQSAGLSAGLEWLLRPQDGPVALLLGLVVVAGLLGWAARGRL